MGTVSIDTAALRSWAGTLQSTAGSVVSVQAGVALAAADGALLPSGAGLGVQAAAAVGVLLGVDANLEVAASAIIAQALAFEAAEAELNASYRAWQEAQKLASAAWTVEENQLTAMSHVAQAAWHAEVQQATAVVSTVKTVGSDIQTWCKQNEGWIGTVASVTSTISAVLGVAAMVLTPIPGIGEIADPVLEAAQVVDSSVNIAADGALLIAGDKEAGVDMALSAAGIATDGIASGVKVLKAGGDVIQEADKASEEAAQGGEAVDDAWKASARLQELKGAAGEAMGNLGEKFSLDSIKDGLSKFGDQSVGDMTKQYAKAFAEKNFEADPNMGGNFGAAQRIAKNLGNAVDAVQLGRSAADGAQAVGAGFQALGSGIHSVVTSPIAPGSIPVTN